MNGHTHPRCVAGIAGVLCVLLALAGAEAAERKAPSRDEPEVSERSPDTRIARPVQDMQRTPSTPVVVGPALKKILRPVGVSVAAETKHNVSQPAEVTSTVVPPNRSGSCPGGRLIISDDGTKNPGFIRGFDLNNLGATASTATFDAVPNTEWRILSNDHDVVTLNDGSILYIRMGQGRSILRPKPNWFDSTYKIQKNQSPWGPGARSIIMVWRSDDCGATFDYRSSIDTARINDDWGAVNDGSAALPQPADDAPPYQMGGTDGSLAKVDTRTGRVFYTMGVVGREPLANSTEFTLTDNRIQRTVVMMSEDRGDSWNETTVLRFRGWRTEVVPLPGNTLAFAAFGKVGAENHSFLAYETVGHIPGPNTATVSFSSPVAEGAWGWDDSPDTSPLGSGIPGQTILTRSPSSQHVLLAYRDTLDNGGGYGYGLYLAGSGPWTPIGSIAPSVAAPRNIVFHLTAIDLGSGPVLFYWYDVNFAAQTATIRGRLFTQDDQYTADFLIGGPFDINPSRWYGHYHTAGGHISKHRTSKVAGQRPRPREVYHYFPIWLQPDALVHSAEVTYDPPEPAQTAPELHFAVKKTPLNVRQVNSMSIEAENIVDNP